MDAFRPTKSLSPLLDFHLELRLIILAVVARRIVPAFAMQTRPQPMAIKLIATTRTIVSPASQTYFPVFMPSTARTPIRACQP